MATNIINGHIAGIASFELATALLVKASRIVEGDPSKNIVLKESRALLSDSISILSLEPRDTPYSAMSAKARAMLDKMDDEEKVDGRPGYE